MQDLYVVDVTYDDGSVAMYGPFKVRSNHKEVKAIEFVDKIKNALNSRVIEAKIRILNEPF